MFKFLKDKLKDSIKKISNKIEEEGQTVEADEEVEEKVEEKKGFFSKIKEKFSKKKEEAIVPEEKGFEEEIEEPEKVEEEEKEVEKKEVEEEITEAPEEKAETGLEETEKKEEKKEEEDKEEVEEIEEIQKEEALKEEEEQRYAEPKEQRKEEPVEEKEEPKPVPEEIEEPAPKKGFFSLIKEKVTTKKINESQFESLFWDLEVSLLENNVAVEVIEKIKSDLKEELVDKPLRRSRLEEIISGTLRKSLIDLLTMDKIDFLLKIKSKKPFVICFVGINGSGKTTTIAKIANLLKQHKLSCVLAAADTFRAASIEQLQKHADNLNVKLIKHNYGSDPAAVAFDAISHAKSKNVDVVLIDTAGRMHSNANLLDEMKKIIRVAKPDMKIFVGEAITGNDCVEQAKEFNDAIGIDAIVLAKADIDEKGGAAVSVSYITKKPIIYLGTGQEYSDLKDFDAEIIVESLGLAS